MAELEKRAAFHDPAGWRPREQALLQRLACQRDDEPCENYVYTTTEYGEVVPKNSKKKKEVNVPPSSLPLNGEEIQPPKSKKNRAD